MKKILKKCPPILAAGLLFSVLISAGAEFDYSDEASASPVSKEILMYTVRGEELSLDCESLEERLMISPQTLRGITFTDIPANTEIYCGERNVGEFEKLAREDIDSLKVTVNDGSERITLGFVANTSEALSAVATVSVLDRENSAPTAQSAEYGTVEETAISGKLKVFDADGDNLRIIVTDKAVKGTVTVDGASFCYTPYPKKSGKDGFNYICEDEFGNRSAECSVKLNIEDSGGFYYEDMDNNLSAYAAVKLCESGIICGEKIGNKYFFAPERQVTRGELVTALVTAVGREDGLSVCVNTGMINDSEIPLYMKPYIKSAVDDGIVTESSFAFNEIPTREETVVLVKRAAGIPTVRQSNFYIEDMSQISEWALDSYKTLDAYGMLDLYDGSAKPKSPLTKEYMADLLWQLYEFKSVKK